VSHLPSGAKPRSLELPRTDQLSKSFDIANLWRALLARTAGGGCPHVFMLDLGCAGVAELYGNRNNQCNHGCDGGCRERELPVRDGHIGMYAAHPCADHKANDSQQETSRKSQQRQQKCHQQHT